MQACDPPVWYMMLLVCQLRLPVGLGMEVIDRDWGLGTTKREDSVEIVGIADRNETATVMTRRGLLRITSTFQWFTTMAAVEGGSKSRHPCPPKLSSFFVGFDNFVVRITSG